MDQFFHLYQLRQSKQIFHHIYCLLNNGRKKGMNLCNSTEKKDINEGVYDLIISSHVIEHVYDPINFLKEQIKLLKPGKYLLIEMPGIFNFHQRNFKLIENLVNAHIYYFHEAFLKNLFSLMKLKILYSDEVCTFLLYKPNNYSDKFNINNIFCGMTTILGE